MSTPQQATEFRPRANWEVTPVIIKTGGGQTGGEEDPPAPRIECTINANDQDFESRLLDDKWGSAKSVEVARIKDVIIADGPNVLPTINANPVGLTVVQITFGEETLIIQDVALPDSEYTKVLISSSNLFSADGGLDKWTESTGDVPAKPPLVVFTQGERTETIHCSFSDVQVTLDVDFGKKM
jgi:hypothetical protein